jgi:hypothetical protein
VGPVASYPTVTQVRTDTRADLRGTMSELAIKLTDLPYSFTSAGPGLRMW